MFRYILFFLFFASINANSPEVEVLQGTLIGATRTNRDGGTYYSFKKIPYAKPPLDELRFKDPVRADGWDDVRDATEELMPCVQLRSETGQEDCLYLNVYTPELPKDNGTLKPVMVWIYGGGFRTGSAKESGVGAQFLLTKDVVLVSINYRVGVFGFLSLDDPDLGVTGNAGLKDQVLALQWVKENIEYFGGDPNNVLIFGQSAGSMSVHYHILSPMSAGLFHKAIMQSGESISDILTSKVRNTGEIYAEALEIQTEDWSNMLFSLQKVSAQKLSEVEESLTPPLAYFTAPTVEIASPNSFIQEDPIDVIRSGNYNHVPTIHGVTNGEGLLIEQHSMQQLGETILITDFSKYIPNDLGIGHGSPEEENLSQRIKYFYYGDSKPTRANITAAVDLYSDYAFAFPAYRSVLEHLKTALEPTYFYYFCAITKLNVKRDQYEMFATYPGVAHGEDNFYIFYSGNTPSNIEEGSVEDLDIKNMVNLWTNFATYGNPTPDSFTDYKWQPLQQNAFNYLRIDAEKSYMEVDLTPERMQFWTDIYNEYLH